MKILTKGKSTPKGSTTVIFSDVRSARLVESGDGTTLHLPYDSEATLRSFRIAVRKIVDELKRHGIQTAHIDDPRTLAPKLAITDDVCGELFAYNLMLAHYSFSRYKSRNEQREVTLSFGAVSPQFTRGLEKGISIATGVNQARDLANTPAGDMTPLSLAKDAQRILKGTEVRVHVLRKREMERLKMGAILGVSRGSKAEPTFIVLEYLQGKKNDAPIVFIGKGITFDTGGINMKPSDGMMDMHLDMTGGATVIGAMSVIAKMGLKRNVIGLIPAAENMVSGESYRPGDILTSMSGTTIDVLNTDAEGRLVMADALTYAERYTPRLVVDVATLTGAALVALGQHASALMTKDDAVASRISELGEESGDYVWRLPLWNEYQRYTKGIHGDIANIASSGNARYGGAINGGMFLSHFATKFPWAHLDVAPRMTAAPGDHLAKGATGEPTALLVKIAEHY